LKFIKIYSLFFKNFGTNYQKSEEVLKYQNRRLVDNFGFLGLIDQKKAQCA